MLVIRRVYVYLLAFVGLGLLAWSIASLARLLIDVALGTPTANAVQTTREEAARWGAGALVGLPVWAVHWWWATRLALRSPDERASTLRRLYVYGVLAAATLIGALACQTVIRATLEWALGRGTPSQALREIPTLLVAAGVWAYHLRAAEADRAAVGEGDGSATLRRWWLYGSLLGGFLLLLAGARDLLEVIARSLVAARPGVGAVPVAEPIANALVGLGVWLLHLRLLPSRLDAATREDDEHSTLRVVAMFLALAICVGATLASLSQLLYYGLARLLGVSRPGGVGEGDVLGAATGPAATALVYGLGWAFQRAVIRAHAARIAEAPRQAGIRRFYTYTVALFALATYAWGAGGLLWTVLDVLLGSADTGLPPNVEWVREQVSAYVTAIVVALPVWLLHWRPSSRVDDAEAHSLSRRLYAYLALIGSMLALVVAGFGVVYRPLTLLLGAAPTGSVLSSLAHSLGLAVVAAVIAAYHWRTIRADAARHHPAPASPAVAEPGPTVLLRLPASDRDAALALLREHGLTAEVVSESHSAPPETT